MAFENDDGLTAASFFKQRMGGYTFDDFILLPGFIDFPLDAVSLSTTFSRGIGLSLPLVSAPMMTGSSMAAAMASIGAIGIVHDKMSIVKQAACVTSIKSHRIPFPHEIVFKASSDSILSAEEFCSAPCIFVTETGSENSKLVGLVNKTEWDELTDKETRLGEYMKPRSLLPADCKRDHIVGYLAKENLDYVPLLANTAGDAMLEAFPKLGFPSLDRDGRLLVAAALGTEETERQRLEELVKRGVDAIVLQSSQASAEYQLEMIKHIKSAYPHLEVIGSNIVSVEQAAQLISTGVDGLRVGYGYSAVAEISEGNQASSVYNVGMYSHHHGVPIICDGEIYTRCHIVKALTLGASTAMLGDHIAGSLEAHELLKLLPETIDTVKQEIYAMGARSLDAAHGMMRSGQLKLENLVHKNHNLTVDTSFNASI